MGKIPLMNQQKAVNSKCGTLTVCTTKSASLNSVKSHLAIRSSQELKASRVSAYSYLIP
jgi:hypothetical protein